MKNEITIDKGKLEKIMMKDGIYPSEIVGFFNYLKSCELPNPWRLWSEEKPEDGRDYEIRLMTNGNEMLSESLILRANTVQWRYADE